MGPLVLLVQAQRDDSLDGEVGVISAVPTLPSQHSPDAYHGPCIRCYDHRLSSGTGVRLRRTNSAKAVPLHVCSTCLVRFRSFFLPTNSMHGQSVRGSIYFFPTGVNVPPSLDSQGSDDTAGAPD